MGGIRLWMVVNRANSLWMKYCCAYQQLPNSAIFDLVRGIELGTYEREARALLPSVLAALDAKSFR